MQHFVPTVSDAAKATNPIPEVEERRASGGVAPPRVGGVPALVVWMIAAIAAVAGLAYWDLQRESRAALEDFADDQAWLAHAVSRALVERLALVERESGGVDAGDAARVARIVSSLETFERPGAVRVLVQPPGSTTLVAPNGSVVEAPVIARALAEPDRRWASLTREEALELGLPHRIAMAGLARADVGAESWRLAIVASAQAERDREERAKARLLLGVGVVTVLVLGFGGIALRRRMKEMELLHALEISALATERDERLLRADKLATLGALAMGIAHEVSTPLGVIVARADQIASRSDLDERIRRNGEVIVSETERINGVIRGLLSLARGDEPTLEEAQPAVLARNAVNLVSHRFSKANVELVLDAGQDIPSVGCDPKLLEQVLVNLLLNACEACAGGGRVEVSVRDDGDKVAFLITDDGVGIQEEDAARVTQPFFTTKPDGTGLGLAIASEIIKHHRGSLTLRPRPEEKGTQAIVEVPTSAASGAHHGLA